MAYQDQIASLELISQDLIELAESIVADFETYCHAGSESDALISSCKKIHKLSKILQFLEFQAAHQLASDCLKTSMKLSNPYKIGDQNLVNAIVYALTILIRYMEYIVTKPIDLPQLLFTTINELRVTAKYPLFKESCFFTANHLKVRETSSKKEYLDDYDIVKTSRRLRQMYQIGLIEVIRKTNVSGGLQMMDRALSRLDSQCGSPNASNLWWVARGAIEGFAQGGLVVKDMRIKLFARLDLQIRALGQINHDLNYKLREEAEHLTLEFLYLVSLSDSDSELTTKMIHHFDIKSHGLTERVLNQEFTLLKGLRDRDFELLYRTILDDILTLQTDLIAEEYGAGSDQLKSLHAQLHQLENMFQLLDMPNKEKLMKESRDIVMSSLSEETGLFDQQRQQVSQRISEVESSLNQLNSTPQSQQTSISRVKLSADEIKHIKKARKLINQVIFSVEEFEAKQHDQSTIGHVSEWLTEAANELDAIQSEFQIIVSDCASLISQKLIEGSNKSNREIIELVADVLCSTDLYLETREKQRTPSQKIYQFAEENLDKLKTS